MRIIIAGPAKAGNTWLRTILAHIYELRPLDTPERPGREFHAFKDWVEADRFPDDTIFHEHFDYSPEFVDIVAAIPAHLVTILRDPYDIFVSLYFYLNNGLPTRKAFDALVGKPLDSPEVLAYLRDGGFEAILLRARKWLESGRSHIVRYERLHSDPLAEVRAVTEVIEPVPDERIIAALEASSAENMRQWDDLMAKHVRVAKVGDSREKLKEEHFAIFSERYGDTIRALGYEVLSPEDLWETAQRGKAKKRRLNSRLPQRENSRHRRIGTVIDPGGGNG